MDNKKIKKPSQALKRILADNIRTYRDQNGLSQEELADMCDLHRTYIGSVEREERNVTLSTLETLANALGIDVPKLLTERAFKDDSPQHPR